MQGSACPTVELGLLPCSRRYPAPARRAVGSELAVKMIVAAIRSAHRRRSKNGLIEEIV